MAKSTTRVPLFLGCACLLSAFAVGAGGKLLAVCGPFTDFTDAAFCPFVLEIFYLGITTGTTPTTYDPAGNVTRLQMAAFLSRTVDGALKRGSRRAAMQRFWTTGSITALGSTTVGSNPVAVKSDGSDLWVADSASATISRVSASDGRLLETWTGAGSPYGVAVAMGRVFAVGLTLPGNLYRIDPAQPPGAVTLVTSELGNGPVSLAFDGSRFWTANFASPPTLSIVTPGFGLPWATATVTAGGTAPTGVLFDGSNVWASVSSGKLWKLDSNAAILQTVTVGSNPKNPLFDGTNIWAPNFSANSVSVVRASTGVVLATLTGNGLESPLSGAFDGQRILINSIGASHNVSLWKAADLTPLGFLSLGPGEVPYGACGDGADFWIAVWPNQLVRF